MGGEGGLQLQCGTSVISSIHPPMKMGETCGPVALAWLSQHTFTGSS